MIFVIVPDIWTEPPLLVIFCLIVVVVVLSIRLGYKLYGSTMPHSKSKKNRRRSANKRSSLGSESSTDGPSTELESDTTTAEDEGKTERPFIVNDILCFVKSFSELPKNQLRSLCEKTFSKNKMKNARKELGKLCNPHCETTHIVDEILELLSKCPNHRFVCEDLSKITLFSEFVLKELQYVEAASENFRYDADEENNVNNHLAADEPVVMFLSQPAESVVVAQSCSQSENLQLNFPAEHDHNGVDNVTPSEKTAGKAESKQHGRVQKKAKEKKHEEDRTVARNEEKKAKEADAEKDRKGKVGEAAKAKVEEERKVKEAEAAKAKAEKESKAKEAEAAKTKAEEESKAKEAEAAKAKAEEERKAKAKAEEERKAREAEAKAKADEERKAREAKAKAEEERKAREAKAKAEEEREVRKAEAKAKADEERKARVAKAMAEEERKARESEAKVKAEEDRKAREAEAKAKAEEEKKAREAEANAKAEKDRKAREAEAKAKAEKESKAKEAEAKAKAGEERKAREAEAKAKAEEERRAREAETNAKAEKDRKAREAEAKAKAEKESKAKEAEAKAKEEDERKAREAEAKAKAEEERRAREAEANAKAEEERKAREAEAKAKAEEERKAREAEAKAKAEEERKAKEAEAKAKAEEERRAREAEAKAKAEEERKAKEAEAKAKAKIEKKAKEAETAKAEKEGRKGREMERQMEPEKGAMEQKTLVQRVFSLQHKDDAKAEALRRQEEEDAREEAEAVAELKTRREVEAKISAERRRAVEKEAEAQEKAWRKADSLNTSVKEKEYEISKETIKLEQNAEEKAEKMAGNNTKTEVKLKEDVAANSKKYKDEDMKRMNDEVTNVEAEVNKVTISLIHTQRSESSHSERTPHQDRTWRSTAQGKGQESITDNATYENGVRCENYFSDTPPFTDQFFSEDVSQGTEGAAEDHTENRVYIARIAPFTEHSITDNASRAHERSINRRQTVGDYQTQSDDDGIGMEDIFRFDGDEDENSDNADQEANVGKETVFASEAEGDKFGSSDPVANRRAADTSPADSDSDMEMEMEDCFLFEGHEEKISASVPGPAKDQKDKPEVAEVSDIKLGTAEVKLVQDAKAENKKTKDKEIKPKKKSENRAQGAKAKETKKKKSGTQQSGNSSSLDSDDMDDFEMDDCFSFESHEDKVPSSHPATGREDAASSADSTEGAMMKTAAGSAIEVTIVKGDDMKVEDAVIKPRMGDKKVSNVTAQVKEGEGSNDREAHSKPEKKATESKAKQATKAKEKEAEVKKASGQKTENSKKVDQETSNTEKIGVKVTEMKTTVSATETKDSGAKLKYETKGTKEFGMKYIGPWNKTASDDKVTEKRSTTPESKSGGPQNETSRQENQTGKSNQKGKRRDRGKDRKRKNFKYADPGQESAKQNQETSRGVKNVQSEASGKVSPATEVEAVSTNAFAAVTAEVKQEVSATKVQASRQADMSSPTDSNDDIIVERTETEVNSEGEKSSDRVKNHERSVNETSGVEGHPDTTMDKSKMNEKRKDGHTKMESKRPITGRTGITEAEATVNTVEKESQPNEEVVEAKGEEHKGVKHWGERGESPRPGAKGRGKGRGRTPRNNKAAIGHAQTMITTHLDSPNRGRQRGHPEHDRREQHEQFEDDSTNGGESESREESVEHETTTFAWKKGEEEVAIERTEHDVTKKTDSDNTKSGTSVHENVMTEENGTREKAADNHADSWDKNASENGTCKGETKKVDGAFKEQFRSTSWSDDVDRAEEKSKSSASKPRGGRSYSAGRRGQKGRHGNAGGTTPTGDKRRSASQDQRTRTEDEGRSSSRASTESGGAIEPDTTPSGSSGQNSNQQSVQQSVQYSNQQSQSANHGDSQLPEEGNEQSSTGNDGRGEGNQGQSFINSRPRLPGSENRRDEQWYARGGRQERGNGRGYNRGYGRGYGGGHDGGYNRGHGGGYNRGYGQTREFSNSQRRPFEQYEVPPRLRGQQQNIGQNYNNQRGQYQGRGQGQFQGHGGQFQGHVGQGQSHGGQFQGHGGQFHGQFQGQGQGGRFQGQGQGRVQGHNQGRGGNFQGHRGQNRGHHDFRGQYRDVDNQNQCPSAENQNAGVQFRHDRGQYRGQGQGQGQNRPRSWTGPGFKPKDEDWEKTRANDEDWV